jgi:hypothetical protein
MTYTNELEVEVDFSDVDPSLLEESEDDTDSTVATLSTSDDVQINQTLRLILLIQMNPIHKMEILDQVVMNQNLQLVEEQLDSLERRLNKR